MKGNIIKLNLLSMIMIFASFAFAQRNTFSFSLTPAVTKLNIKNFPNYTFLSDWNKYYYSKKNDMPVFNISYGVSYQRDFGKFDVGIGFFYTELAQQSGLFYQSFGIDKYPKSYGGSNYVMTYKGVEFPLIFNYKLNKNSRWAFNLEYGLSLNFMLEFEVQDFVVVKDDGLYRKSSTTATIAGINNSTELFFYRIFHAEKNMIRIANWIGFKIDYSLHKNLSFSLTPTLKYYSNTLKQANNNDSLDADAFLFGTQLNLNLKF